LLLYSVIFGAFMSLGAKKFDRYLLPIFPALEIVAAVGLGELVHSGWSCCRAPRIMGTPRQGTSPRHPLSIYHLTGLVVAVIQLALALPHHPYYLTYYNPLLGGGPQAKNTLVVGWGEGYEKAAAYLNGKRDAEALQAAVPTFTAFAPLFSGETVPTSDYSGSQTDYVVFYLAQVQRQHDKTLMEQYFSNDHVQPEHVVTLRGVDYAWIYPNLHYVQPLSYLQDHGQPGREILLINEDSVLGKHYEGSLQVRAFTHRSSPKEVANLLDDLPPDVQDVWHARHRDGDPEAVTQLLRNRGLVVRERAFQEVKLVRYSLLEDQPAMEDLALHFGDLKLSGYAATDPLPAWGRDGGVRLRWASQQAPQGDYTAFVHLYDSRGRRISQGDSLILDQTLRPTSHWEPGTVGITLHQL
jgi:hypothetical protein